MNATKCPTCTAEVTEANVINANTWTGTEYVRVDFCSFECCKKAPKAPRTPRAPRTAWISQDAAAVFAFGTRR